MDKVSCGRSAVPWGMIAGPDEALYVAVNDGYRVSAVAIFPQLLHILDFAVHQTLALILL